VRPYAADIPDSEPTPREWVLGRRAFLRASALAGLAGSGCAVAPDPPAGPDPRIVPPLDWPAGFAPTTATGPPLPPAVPDHALTPRSTAARHNNFYEFLPNRGGDVWPRTHDFQVEPWTLEVAGACERPAVLSLADLHAVPHEERLYHFRCVERWAMNVPWVGFPLARLLERVRPAPEAAFVRFVSAMRPDQMPGVRGMKRYPWPYHEGLRLDEAMHDLTLVATGMYGAPLPRQHGAPVRLVVPWKYGYKGAKSITRIELVAARPATFWSTLQPHEYGFLSNVNPGIPHPRWSQAQSWWLHDRHRTFPTPVFNGYERYVAGLYPDEPRQPQEALRPGQVAR
jgi:sulfoxide reductase catalytic subunit YedY